MMWGCCQDCWCVRWVRVFKRGGGSASPPFIDGRLRERERRPLSNIFLFFETGRTPLENCLPWHYDDYLFLLPLSFSEGLKKGTLFHFVLIVIFFDYYCIAFYSTRVFLFLFSSLASAQQFLRTNKLSRNLWEENWTSLTAAVSLASLYRWSDAHLRELCWNQMAAE